MSIESPTFIEPAAGIGAEEDAAAPDESRVRIIVATVWVIFAAACLVVRMLYPFDLAGDQSHGWFLDHLLPRIQRMIGGWSLEMMLFYPLGVLGIFLLERRFPAVPTQKTLSIGAVNDAFWVVIQSAAGVIFFAWYGRMLTQLYGRYLGFLTLPVSRWLPPLAAMAIALVVLDLARWFQHWLHHKVPWLWPFHAVHHAQRELNLFTDDRIHFMEYFVRRPAAILPMLMLGLNEPEVTWVILLLEWHSRLYHANIRSDFGLLRYVLVTPQSHRVHHSRDPLHFEHNYGAMLSIWDYLFGTQYRRYDVYPETGIADEKFPAETARSVRGMLFTPVRQMLYPFQQLWTFSRTDRPRPQSR